MWEIYTLYMINEDEKVAVSYYTDRSPAHLEKDGEELLKESNYDRYEVLGMLGMFGKKEKEVLNDYKVLKKYEYEDAQPTIRGMKLELIK